MDAEKTKTQKKGLSLVFACRHVSCRITSTNQNTPRVEAIIFELLKLVAKGTRPALVLGGEDDDRSIDPTLWVAARTTMENVAFVEKI